LRRHFDNSKEYLENEINIITRKSREIDREPAATCRQEELKSKRAQGAIEIFIVCFEVLLTKPFALFTINSVLKTTNMSIAQCMRISESGLIL
jgi:hypothetical protein